jgi:hypothetical protein
LNSNPLFLKETLKEGLVGYNFYYFHGHGHPSSQLEWLNLLLEADACIVLINMVPLIVVYMLHIASM